MASDERIIRKVESDPDWYARQVGRAVVIHNRETDEEIVRYEPPKAWGDGWSWNLCDEGIYFAREEKLGS